MKDVTEMVKNMQAEIETLKSDLEAAKAELTQKDEAGEKARMEETIAKLEAKIAEGLDRMKEFEKLQKEAEENKANKEKLEKMQADQRKSEIDGAIERLKKDKHLFPKDESRARALMESFGADAIKLSVPDGDDDSKTKEVEETQLQLLDALLSSRKHSAFAEISPAKKDDNQPAEPSGRDIPSSVTFSAGDNKGNTMDVVDGELNAKIEAFIKKHPDATFEEAVDAVG